MPLREEFPLKIRQAVALRAQYTCSFPACRRPTAGPSDESTSAVASIGVAAHICAAAPGGPRYVAAMSSEERKGIGNAIWMCATHATLIDQDVAKYTADVLIGWKRGREREAAAALEGTARGTTHTASREVIEIGPGVVAMAEMTAGAGATWEFALDHFIVGDFHDLVRFSEDFEKISAYDRYVLVESFGDGRVLKTPPRWNRNTGRLVVTTEVFPRFARERAQDLGRDVALGANGDITLNWETIAGVEALPQKLMLCLSYQKASNFIHGDFGTKVAEYHSLYRSTRWLKTLMKLEAIRLASIPYADATLKTEYTPFVCVDRVHDFCLLDGGLAGSWCKAFIDLEVNGLGRWSTELSVFIGKHPPESPAPRPSWLAGPRG